MNYSSEYNKNGKPIMSLPLLSLNQMLVFSALAFATGILLTIALMK